MVEWPSRGALRLETGVRIPPKAFFIRTEAPQRTEAYLRTKRLVCAPSPFENNLFVQIQSDAESFTFCAQDLTVAKHAGLNSELKTGLIHFK